MFNPDFFPTPAEVAALMLDPFDLRGKIILEPSAGSGNLIKECLERGAQEVMWCEKEAKLQNILSSIQGAMPCTNCSNFLLLEAHEISHIDFIAMNPPFSADERHILHAWEVAPPGCHIVSLCNWNTISGNYRGLQFHLASIIESYGDKQDLGQCFVDSERSTQVQIGMVHLTKPRTTNESEFEGFFLGADDIEAQGHGLIPYRRSRDIVNRYVEACRLFDRQVDIAIKMSGILDGFFGKDLGMQVTLEGAPVSRNRFRKELQKSAWKYIFAQFLPQHMATSQLAKDINLFVEQQSHVPFTERNLWRMLQIIAATQEQRVDRAIEDAIDTLTMHTKENRYGLEGWATNRAHLIGQKFIRSYMAEPCWTGNGVRLKTYGRASDEIRDLIKALCFITGQDYEKMALPTRDAELKNIYNTGEWYEWGFFLFKAFKKGTVHFKFRSLDEWAMLNRRYAKIKGQTLPEKL